MAVPWTRMILRTLGSTNRNFHTSKCLALFYETPDKDGFQQKSEEEKEWETLSLKERILLELKLYKEACKESLSEAKEAIVNPRVFVRDMEIEPIWRFTGNPEELKQWVVTTDKDNNIGFSTAQLNLTSYGKGLFHGFLDTKLPADGEIKRTGYCNLRVLPRLTPFRKNVRSFDWGQYTHLVFNVRGDGRVYTVNLHLHREFDVAQYDTYHYFIWTRGGPYWQQVKIPFSKFFFAYKGRIQCWNEAINKLEVGSISFSIADKVTGPFRFEIDYIGIENIPAHSENTAYETYEFDQKFW